MKKWLERQLCSDVPHVAWWVALQCDNEMVLDTAKDGVTILGEAQCVPTASIHHPCANNPG